MSPDSAVALGTEIHNLIWTQGVAPRLPQDLFGHRSMILSSSWSRRRNHCEIPSMLPGLPPNSVLPIGMMVLVDFANSEKE